MDKKQAVKVVAFAAMSDGCISKPNRKDRPNNNVNCYFRFGQVTPHEDFVRYINKHVSYFTGTREAYIEPSKGSKRKNKFFEICSKRHPMLTKMYDRLYIMGHKTIDPHYLTLLDWEALAILFMSDGHGRFKGKTSDFTLNLCRLSYAEQGLLKKHLKAKLDLDWNINKNSKYYCLRLANKDFNKFKEGIEEYILPSFKYKLYPND